MNFRGYIFLRDLLTLTVLLPLGQQKSLGLCPNDGSTKLHPQACVVAPWLAQVVQAPSHCPCSLGSPFSGSCILQTLLIRAQLDRR